MNFHETGLPKNKLIEDAFTRSYATLMLSQADAVKDVKGQIKEMYEENLLALENARAKMSQAQYDMNKVRLEKQYQDQLKIAPLIVTKELNSIFQIRTVFSALESTKNVSSPSMELTAAVLMMECIRSPLDYLAIDKAFGANVSNILAHVAHLEVYPEQRAENFKKVSDDTKRAYLLLMTGSMNQIMAATKKGSQIKLQPGQEEHVVADLSAVWGTDQKLEARFADIFSETLVATKSDFRLDLSSGKPELVKADKPNNNRPPRGPAGSRRPRQQRRDR